MSVKLHIKKGDMVYVNAGDSKGQQDASDSEADAGCRNPALARSA